MKEANFIWLNGELVRWAEARVHFLTHTLHYGNGAFEGLRGYFLDPEAQKNLGGKIAVFKLEAHTKRLLNSCKIAQIHCPYDFNTLVSAQIELVRANLECFSSGIYIRPLVFLGYGSMGISHRNAPTDVGIAAWEWGAYLGEEALQNGIAVKTSSISRNSPKNSMNKAKLVGNYLNSALAKFEATECGYDEAILLDDAGNVTEGSGECIFIVRDGELITPPHANSLESITQSTVIDIAEALGFRIWRRNITRDEIYIADEAFFTGTAAEITPIKSLDARQIGQSRAGEITKKIQKKYFEIVHGLDPEFTKFLTII